MFAAEGGERARREEGTQALSGSFRLEMPVLEPGQAPAGRQRNFICVGDERFGGSESRVLLGQKQVALRSAEFENRELAGTHVDPGEPGSLGKSGDRCEVAILGCGEQRGLSYRPRREDPRDCALDQPLAWLADLLGDSNGMSRGQEACQIVVQRVVWDAGHRHPTVTAERA